MKRWKFLKKADVLKFSILIILVAATAAVSFYFDIDDLRPEAVQSWVSAHGILAPFVYIVIFTIAGATLIPGTPVAIAGGALFGWFLGSVYTVIGATVGAIIAFLASRYLGEGFVTRHIKERELRRVEKYKRLVEDKSFRGIVLLRLMPLVPFTVLSMVLGLTKVRFWKYTIATFFGIMPGTFAYVYFGQSLFELDPLKTSIAVGILIVLTVFAYQTNKKLKIF